MDSGRSMNVAKFILNNCILAGFKSINYNILNLDLELNDKISSENRNQKLQVSK